MNGTENSLAEVERFLAGWQEGETAMKQLFAELLGRVAAMADTSLTFVARPGVSYSLRPRHQHQRDRELFAIIDVIDDTPAERWLSVCFYGDMISDPEERGEVIPGGLAGSDGYCFDVYEADEAIEVYLASRLDEAWRKAAQ